MLLGLYENNQSNAEDVNKATKKTKTTHKKREEPQGQRVDVQKNCFHKMPTGNYKGKSKEMIITRTLLQGTYLNSRKATFDKLESGSVLQPIKSQFNEEKWLPIARDMPFLVSHYCCSAMKKSPLGIYSRTTKQKPYLGVLATESRCRKQAWIRQGCNAFDGRKPHSSPLSFWTEQDILAYIKRYNLDICSVYGEIEETSDGKLRCTKAQRTGCIFCGFGAHLDRKGHERFLMLKESHPKQYDYCINGGQWSDNPYYDPKASTEPDEMGWVNWNPKKIWTPSDKGLGFGVVFDYLNAEYGDSFIRYK